MQRELLRGSFLRPLLLCVAALGLSLASGGRVVAQDAANRGAAGGVALQAREAAGAMWSAQVKPSIGGSPAAASVWARGRLRDLEDRYAIERDEALEKEIVTTSLRFGVQCRFTAFLAVDRSEVVNHGGIVHSIVQPVEQPGHTDSWLFRNHTRILKRKSWERSAPTGHTSARLPA